MDGSRVSVLRVAHSTDFSVLLVRGQNISLGMGAEVIDPFLALTY